MLTDVAGKHPLLPRQPTLHPTYFPSTHCPCQLTPPPECSDAQGRPSSSSTRLSRWQPLQVDVKMMAERTCAQHSSGTPCPVSTAVQQICSSQHTSHVLTGGCMVQVHGTDMMHHRPMVQPDSCEVFYYHLTGRSYPPLSNTPLASHDTNNSLTMVFDASLRSIQDPCSSESHLLQIFQTVPQTLKLCSHAMVEHVLQPSYNPHAKSWHR